MKELLEILKQKKLSIMLKCLQLECHHEKLIMNVVKCNAVCFDFYFFEFHINYV